MTAILADLEAIWLHVLETHFSIEKKDLGSYKAVLIIPDVYNRTYLRELTTLLLLKMGFGSCFLVQVTKQSTYSFDNAENFEFRIMWRQLLVLD